MITLEEYEKMSKDERRIYFLSVNEDEELKNMDSWDRILFFRMKEGLSPELIRKNIQNDYKRTITPPLNVVMGWK